MSSTKTWIMSFRNPDRYRLAKKYPYDFIMLDRISHYACREKNVIEDLDVDEVKISKDKMKEAIGISPARYRNGLERLEKMGFITCKPTRDGTIVKLVDKTIFNNNSNESSTPNNTHPTHLQHRTNTEPTPNNNKERKNKKDNKRKINLSRQSYDDWEREGKRKKFLDTDSLLGSPEYKKNAWEWYKQGIRWNGDKEKIKAQMQKIKEQLK